MITYFLVFIICLYGVSRLYSSITGKVPESKIESAQLKEAFQKNSGVWWFMYPITSLLFLIYESILWTLWFVGELFFKLIEILKWLYHEIILCGVVLTLKLIWHYLVVCPWRIFRSAFILMPKAAKWQSYKIGVWGIFFSLFILLMARFFSTYVFKETSILQLVVQHTLQLLSILPLGIAGALITHDPETTWKNSWKENGFAFLKLASLLLLPIVLILSVEYLIIYIGSLTSIHFTLSTLLMGGSLLSSLVLLINCCLVIFLVSALPSFANHYKGSWSAFYPTFAKHIFHSWMHYLIALPAILIPTIILSIIPFFVTQGVTYLSQKTTNLVYDQRIHEEQILASKGILGYKEWCNTEKISEDSLQILIDNDLKLLDAKLASNGLVRGKEHLENSYSSYSSEYGAAPIGVLYFLYDQYSSFQNSQIHTHKIQKSSDLGTGYQSDHKNLVNDSIEMSNALQNAQKYILEKEKELSLVCMEPTENDETTTTVIQSKEENKNPPTEPTKDICDIRRENITIEIQDAKKFINLENQIQSRRAQVLLHLNNIKNKLESKNQQDKYFRALAFLLSGIWLCFLASLTYGYGLSMLSHLNKHIYNETDLTEWYIVSEVKNAHAKNINQPILGMGVTLIILTLLFISQTEMGRNLLQTRLPQIEMLNWNFQQANSPIETNISDQGENNSTHTQKKLQQDEKAKMELDNDSISIHDIKTINELINEANSNIEIIESELGLTIAKTCMNCQKKFDPRQGFSVSQETGAVEPFEISRTSKYCSEECAYKHTH